MPFMFAGALTDEGFAHAADADGTVSPVLMTSGLFAGDWTGGPGKVFILVVTYEGSDCSDTAGNTYTLLDSNGDLSVWYSQITHNLVSHSDSISSTGATALMAMGFGADPTTPFAGQSLKVGTYTSAAGGESHTEDTDPVTLPATYQAGAVLVFGFMRGSQGVSGGTAGYSIGAAAGPGKISTNTSATNIGTLSGGVSDQGTGAGHTGFAINHSVGGDPVRLWASSARILDLPLAFAPFSGAAQGEVIFATGTTSQPIEWGLLCVVTSWLDLSAPPPPPPPPVAGNDGVDLAVNSRNWLFCAYRDGTNVKARVFRPGETAWDTAVTVAADADATTDFGAAPCIAVDKQDHVYVWYHTAAPNVKGFRSVDNGLTFGSVYTTLAAKRYPKIAFRDESLLVAMFNGDNLNVYESQDFGVTVVLAVTFAAQTLQRPCLGTDKHNSVHVLWQSAANEIVHRMSDAPSKAGTWSAEETIAVGAALPGYAVGFRRALATWFYGADWFTFAVGLLKSNFAQKELNAVSPLANFAQCWPGLIYDGHDQCWLLERADQPDRLPLLWLNPDGTGQNWHVIAAGGGF